jgi:hypothetical protein
MLALKETERFELGVGFEEMSRPTEWVWTDDLFLRVQQQVRPYRIRRELTMRAVQGFSAGG